MAGSIPRTCSERFVPFFFQPTSTRWMHRGIQTVFRRFSSSSENHNVSLGAPEAVYPGHPKFHLWERSVAEHMKWKPSPKLYEPQEETVTMTDLIAEVRKLNERFEQILPLLKITKP